MAVSLLEDNLAIVRVGYSKKHAERLRRDFIKSGVDVFKDKRVNNRDRILTKAERMMVVEALQKKQPKDVIAGCELEHWTTTLLGMYIFESTGKKYKSKTSEHLLFREAKLTFHLPGKSYEKADPIARDTWVKETKPILDKLMLEPGTTVLCEDEMVLTAKTTTQRIWLPAGEYPPVLEVNGTRKNKSFYGFLNLKTGQEHAFITDWQNMYITVEILNKLRKVYPTEKLVIIWDNCGWHRGSKVTEWIKTDGNTQTLYFPPYTPDLNPQEHVWKAGRKAITHNQYIQKIEETAIKFKDYIEKARYSATSYSGIGQFWRNTECFVYCLI
ncbi:MAG: IS630 family transposase [Candidatus Colwellbacteria bacterium]|nr:IS630 family transposase [Candidatus Colwellbacteria bacterium]